MGWRLPWRSSRAPRRWRRLAFPWGRGVAERSRWSVTAIAEWACRRPGETREPASGIVGVRPGEGPAAWRAGWIAATEPSPRRIWPRHFRPVLSGGTDGWPWPSSRTSENRVDVARSDRLAVPVGHTAVEWEGYEHLLAAGRAGKGCWSFRRTWGRGNSCRPCGRVAPTPPTWWAAAGQPALDDLLTAWRERGGTDDPQAGCGPCDPAGLRRGETAAILIDQHISEREGAVVPFFVVPPRPRRAALIALSRGSGAPVAIVRHRTGTLPDSHRRRDPVRRSGDLKAIWSRTPRASRGHRGHDPEAAEQCFGCTAAEDRQPVDARLRPPETHAAESGQRLAG